MIDWFSSNSVITQHTVQETVAAEGATRGKATFHGFITKQSPVVPVGLPQPLKVSCSTAGSDTDGTSNSLKLMVQLPPNIDPEVFRHLPEEIQQELLSPAYANSLSSPLIPASSPSTPAVGIVDLSRNTPVQCPPPFKPVLQSLSDSQVLKDRKEAVSSLVSSDRSTTMNHHCPPGTSTVSGEKVMEEGRTTSPQSSDCDFPVNVDPKVFSELPLDVQRELMCEWKQQKPVPKTPSSRKAGRTLMTKDKKPAGKGSQANNLFKYFKPN